MGKARVGSPVGVALVSTVLAGLVVALALSFVLDDGDDQVSGDATVITLDPDSSVTITAPPNTTVGATAPDFTFEDLTTGDEIEFTELRGDRPALVNFFSQTCIPCITEMPDLEDAYQEYGGEVAFLGLAYQDSPEVARRLVDRTGVTYETGRDVVGEILADYEGTGLPLTVFVRADGTVAEIYTRKLQPSDLERELEALAA